MIIAKNLQGTPFAGENELGQAVAVEVAENGPANQADSGKAAGVLFVEHKFAALTSEYQGGGRLRIMPRHHAATDKQIKMAIPVDVGQGHRTGAGFLGRQKVTNCL